MREQLFSLACFTGAKVQSLLSLACFTGTKVQILLFHEELVLFLAPFLMIGDLSALLALLVQKYKY